MIFSLHKENRAHIAYISYRQLLWDNLHCSYSHDMIIQKVLLLSKRQTNGVLAIDRILVVFINDVDIYILAVIFIANVVIYIAVSIIIVVVPIIDTIIVVVVVLLLLLLLMLFLILLPFLLLLLFLLLIYCFAIVVIMD